MPKPKNEPIGECPCPARGCDVIAQVFKFRARADVSKRWLAGKMYLSCEQHGRFGADGAQAMQEYILENSHIWDEKERASHAGAHAKSSQPAPSQPTPEPAPAPPPVPKKSRDLWDM